LAVRGSLHLNGQTRTGIAPVRERAREKEGESE
jgi:hypothetical protein